MQQFDYVINDPLGLHARPAGMLAKAAKEFADTTITITTKENVAQVANAIAIAKKGNATVKKVAPAPVVNKYEVYLI